MLLIECDERNTKNLDIRNEMLCDLSQGKTKVIEGTPVLTGPVQEDSAETSSGLREWPYRRGPMLEEKWPLPWRRG